MWRHLVVSVHGDHELNSSSCLVCYVGSELMHIIRSDFEIGVRLHVCLTVCASSISSAVRTATSHGGFILCSRRPPAVCTFEALCNMYTHKGIILQKTTTTVQEFVKGVRLQLLESQTEEVIMLSSDFGVQLYVLFSNFSTACCCHLPSHHFARSCLIKAHLHGCLRKVMAHPWK